jgi:hypothetical protein
MPPDITKPNNHIYWLWAAYVALAGMMLTGYISLRDRGEIIKDKVAVNELRLQTQLAEIKTKLTSIDASLLELKNDMRQRHE